MFDKKVNIIIPVYNGEKYIAQQIESLLNQTYGNIDIYVRDDMSKDRTLDIVSSYVGKEPEGKRIIIIKDDCGNKGYVRNVFETWRESEPADYYCFCDQDDVWHKDKVEKCVAYLEKKDSNRPMLLFTAYNFCDSDMNFIRTSDSINEKLSLKNVLYDYLALNFNITVNNSFKVKFFDNLPKNGKYPHYPDQWMSQVAAIYNGLYYLPVPTVEYRRNEGAVTYSNRNGLSFLIWRIRRFLFGDETKLVRRELNSFYHTFCHDMTKKDRKLMKQILKRGFRHSLIKFMFPGRFRKKISDEIALRVMFLFGLL